MRRRRTNIAEGDVIGTRLSELMFKAAVLVLTVTISLIAQGPTEQPKKDAVWAAISIQPSVLWRNQTEHLQIYFSVVNDGRVSIKPRTGSSHLLINGVEVEHSSWDYIVGNGLRHPYIENLPPGQLLEFIRGFGEYFKKPGIYTVGWSGVNFKAADITIRVLPVDRYSFDGRPIK